LLCELLANADPARYERAALRWLATVHRRAVATPHRGRARPRTYVARLATPWPTTSSSSTARGSRL